MQINWSLQLRLLFRNVLVLRFWFSRSWVLHAIEKAVFFKSFGRLSHIQVLEIKHITLTNFYLTFKNLAPYIQDGCTVTLQMLHFIYIYFSTNISTEYFKHVAHSLFFSSKCRLLHNAAFLVPVLSTFYIQGVLKFKCKTPVPKG